MRSKASHSPIVKYIVLNAIKELRNKQRILLRERIDASLVPKVKYVLPQSPQKSFKEGIKINQPVMEQKNEEFTRPFLQTPSKPLKQPKTYIPQQKINSSISPQTQNTQIQQGYGRIEFFIRDPTVSIIDCPGPNQTIYVGRMGQRQPTKILLSEEEIEAIFKFISKKTQIPLIEGVFRVNVDNFGINGVYSKDIGSRFILKKIF